MSVNKRCEMAYFAGIMDGDGSFSLCKKIDGVGRSPLYYPLIQLSTTNYSLVDMLLVAFGGSSNIRKSYIPKDGSARKESKRWKLEKRNQCLPFLESIVDFLVVKKERGMFLLDYILSNPFKRGSIRIEDDVLKKRDSSYMKMQELNNDLGNLYFKFPKRRKDSQDLLFWHYFAGLMDTDGSFSIKKEKTGRYAPMILLTMIDHKAFELIVKNCVWGKISHIKAKTSRNGYCYRFGLYSVEDCSLFLERILPLLRLKNHQAAFLYEYCKLRTITKKMTAEEHDSWYVKVKECNQYGVSKSSLMDLKLLPGYAEDNKAQAAQAGSVNVASEKTHSEVRCGALDIAEMQ